MLCGIVFAWIALGGTAAHLLAYAFGSEPNITCRPYHTILSTVEMYCAPFPAFTTAFKIFMVWPAFGIAPFAMAIGLAKLGMLRLVEAAAWSVIALIIATVIGWPGFRFWWRRSHVAAGLITAPAVATIIYLGARM